MVLPAPGRKLSGVRPIHWRKISACWHVVFPRSDMLMMVEGLSGWSFGRARRSSAYICPISLAAPVQLSPLATLLASMALKSASKSKSTILSLFSPLVPPLPTQEPFGPFGRLLPA